MLIVVSKDALCYAKLLYVILFVSEDDLGWLYEEVVMFLA